MSDWPSDQLEALHACHLVEGLFEQHVLDASYVTDRTELQAKATSVHEAIADLYQAIGSDANKEKGR
jgi:hypothetical protein